MRIIKVPTNTLQVRYEEQQPVITKEENYFWFVLKGLLRTTFRAMSAYDVHKNIEFHDDVLSQDGANELRIQRESDYELLKGWVNNGKNWPGEAKDIDAVFMAFQKAEEMKAAKVKPKEEKAS